MEHRFAHDGNTLVTRDDDPRTWTAEYRAFTRGKPLRGYDGVFGDGVNWVITFMDERGDADPAVKASLRDTAIEAIKETYPEAFERGSEVVSNRGTPRGLVRQPRCPDDVQAAARRLGVPVSHDRAVMAEVFRGAASSRRADDLLRLIVEVLAAAIEAGDAAAQARWAAWVADPVAAAAREIQRAREGGGAGGV